MRPFVSQPGELHNLAHRTIPQTEVRPVRRRGREGDGGFTPSRSLKDCVLPRRHTEICPPAPVGQGRSTWRAGGLYGRPESKHLGTASATQLREQRGEGGCTRS